MKKQAHLEIALTLFLTSGLGGCGEAEPPAPSARASVALDVSAQGCDVAHPIAAHVTNISEEQIDGVEFVISGQEIGHSTFLASSGSIKTDKIMTPGEVYSICVETPMAIRPAPADVKWNYTVEVQNVWGGQSS